MFGLSKEVYEKEPEIHDAFKRFIYENTGWKIVTFEGNYTGLTADRYKSFRHGFLACDALRRNK